MEAKKVTIKWSKKENDWICNYPTNAGKILGNNLFTMIQEFEKWKGYELREVIKNAGFDPDSFVISIKKTPD